MVSLFTQILLKDQELYAETSSALSKQIYDRNSLTDLQRNAEDLVRLFFVDDKFDSRQSDNEEFRDQTMHSTDTN